MAASWSQTHMYYSFCYKILIIIGHHFVAQHQLILKSKHRTCFQDLFDYLPDRLFVQKKSQGPMYSLLKDSHV